MHRNSFVAFAATAIVVAAAPSLHAQSLDGRPIQVGLMGGLTSPTGSLTTSVNHAGNAGALVTIGTPVHNLRFRVDGQWQQMAGRTYDPSLACVVCRGSFTQRNYRMFDATANVVYGGTVAKPLNLYVIGGVGLYELRLASTHHAGEFVASAASDATRFGFNGGVGASVRLGHVATFVEARFHQLVARPSLTSDGFYQDGLPGPFQFVPVSVGIVF
jgi:hypothetical protein